MKVKNMMKPMTEKEKLIKKLLKDEMKDVAIRKRLFLNRFIVANITSSDLFGFQDSTIPTPYTCSVAEHLRDVEKGINLLHNKGTKNG